MAISSKGPKKLTTVFLAAITLVFLFLPYQVARADIGPKPTMDFEFVFEDGSDLSIVEGVLLECDQPDCEDAVPLEDLGPQRFRCSQANCESMAYGYSDYHRLRITFSDGKTRESNIFTKEGFEAKYRVVVRESDLLVEEVGGISRLLGPLGSGFGLMVVAGVAGGCFVVVSFLGLLTTLVILIVRADEGRGAFSDSRLLFIIAWILSLLLLALGAWFTLAIPVTAVIEVILAVVYASIRKRDRIVLVTSALIANTITALMLWIEVFVLNSDISLLELGIAEIFIWLVEALIYYLIGRKTMPFREALALSFVLNATSFLIGLVLFV